MPPRHWQYHVTTAQRARLARTGDMYDSAPGRAMSPVPRPPEWRHSARDCLRLPATSRERPWPLSDGGRRAVAAVPATSLALQFGQGRLGVADPPRDSTQTAFAPFPVPGLRLRRLQVRLAPSLSPSLGSRRHAGAEPGQAI